MHQRWLNVTNLTGGRETSAQNHTMIEAQLASFFRALRVDTWMIISRTSPSVHTPLPQTSNTNDATPARNNILEARAPYRSRAYVRSRRQYVDQEEREHGIV